MVAAARRGQSLRAVARQFGVGIATVAYWVERAEGQRLDRVDWSDHSHAPHTTLRTATAVWDLVEGLVINDGPQVEVLNGVSLHGGLVVSWPTQSPVTAAMTVASLTEHWRAVGLPGYAQFDNDMTFHGTPRYPDALGRVVRLCLSLGVVPVFVPPRDTGFQAMIESYNGWSQTPVVSLFQHQHLEQLQGRSERPRPASPQHLSARIE